MPRAGTTRKAPSGERQRDDFLWTVEAYLDRSLLMPDIIEFSLSDQFCGQRLYPKQGTLLKIICLQDELFTQFDYDCIGEWTDSFARTHDNGIQVDILERIQINKAEGRRWFGECLMALGRRASKGFIGAIAGAYVLYYFIQLGNPQEHYGLMSEKHLGMYVFAGKKEQAITNQWGDLNNLIQVAPVFQPYLSPQALKEDIHIFVPHDFVRIQDRQSAGNVPNLDSMASLEVTPKESTKISARGPALFSFFFDEMAHVTREVARADASEVYGQAKPALATFGKDSFIYAGSSPWQMIGQFYENAQQAVKVSDGLDGQPEGTIASPAMMFLQLESWRPYEAWREAHEILVRPPKEDKPTQYYPRQRNAHYEYNDDARREEAANVDKYAVEYRAKWGAVLDAYLNPDAVDRMLLPWPLTNPKNLGRPVNSLVSDYFVHADPSKSGKNTGLVMAHLERTPSDPMPHMVVDLVHHWEPAKFVENNFEIDYRVIIQEMKQLIYNFMPSEVTFDQGYSSFLIQELRSYVRDNHFPKTINIFQRTATFAYNWEVAEVFKTAMGLGLVHLPLLESESRNLLVQESKFLTLVADRRVDHPTVGPVQTKDIWDCLAILTHAFLGKHIASMLGADFLRTGISGSQPGGLPLSGGFSHSLGPGDDLGAPQRPPVIEVASRMKQIHNARRRAPAPVARGGRFNPLANRMPFRRR